MSIQHKRTRCYNNLEKFMDTSMFLEHVEQIKQIQMDNGVDEEQAQLDGVGMALLLYVPFWANGEVNP